MFNIEKDKLLTTAQVAEMLGLKAVTVRQWIGKRKIGSVKVGDRAVRVPAAEVEKIIEHDYTPALPARER